MIDKILGEIEGVNDACERPLNLLGLNKCHFCLLLDTPPPFTTSTNFLLLPLYISTLVEETDENKGWIADTSCWAGLKDVHDVG